MLLKKPNHPTKPLFQKLNILHFEKLKLLKIGIFMWKVLNDKVPQTLKDHFSIRERNYSHNNAKFHFPLANTNLFKQDVVYRGPKHWNSALLFFASTLIFLSEKAHPKCRTTFGRSMFHVYCFKLMRTYT